MIAIINNYKTILIEEKPYFLDTSTGEVIESITFTAPIGSKIYTPEQQAWYEKYKLAELKKQHYKKQTNELGSFYFVLSNLNIFEGLSPETTARLVFLITFINYHGDLMKNHKTKMKKSDLGSMLGLSDATIFRFWKEINGKYIFEDSDGYLKLTLNDLFQKGKLKKYNDYDFHQRFYINAIRNLYKKTDISKHKHLGYVFKMLPFINIEYNILCDNPFETDEKEIHPISFNVFCDCINYSDNQRKRLIKTYSEIKFNVGNTNELFCSFVSDGINTDNQRIFVNPHVIYGGSDYKKVEVLGIFCR